MSTTTPTPTGTIAIANVRPFGWRDKVGYLFGDLGNDFVFILASSYLMVFYTNVAGIDPAHLAVVFFGARLVDAFADLIWGRFLDTHKPSRLGRFRGWIAKGAVPLTVVSALLYLPAIADWDYALRIAYAGITYLLWGSVFYTMVSISYGASASVISTNPTHRASLSVFRALGANTAGIFVALVPPLFIYTTVDGVAQVLPESFFTIGVIFAGCSLLFYAVCVLGIRERVERPADAVMPPLKVMLRSLVGNRALVSIMAANLTIMLSALLTGSMAAYLWLNYFNDGALSGPAQLAGFLPALLLVPVSTWIAKRFGKREAVVAGMSLASLLYFTLAVLRVDSPWVYIGVTLVAGLGVGIHAIFVWAMIGDVIDEEEVRSGTRSDGSVYSINTWARQLGIAVAGGLGGLALVAVGFQSGQPVQSDETIQGIYLVCTIVPGTLFAVAALIMLLWYPLSRARVAANTAELAARRDQEA
jgi:GPH family glycoside/pentoside/hexuronide:cation symporter